MPNLTFDYGVLYDALDTKRRDAGLLWRDVAHATGVSQSTFTRLKKGSGLDVDNLLRLVNWLNPNDLQTFDLGPYIIWRSR